MAARVVGQTPPLLALVFTASLIALTCVEGFAKYLDEIPNSGSVRRHGVTWNAVGHTASDPTSGYFPRNVFGLAFAANNHTWDATLCSLDSDGDGFTNGEELGDPNCTWRPLTIPARRTDISHPGFADSYPTSFTLSPTSNAAATLATKAWVMSSLLMVLLCSTF